MSTVKPDDREIFDLKKTLNMAIVGGGKGCESFLRIVTKEMLGNFHFNVIGIADLLEDSPGITYARTLGIPTITTDYHDLLNLDGLDVIVELTGRIDVRDEIERLRPKGVRLVDSFGANLFWELYTAEEARLQQKMEMREQVEAEQEWIKQIFDSIPDEIMVLDLNCMVQHANVSLLRNNDFKLKDVRGKFCYDLDLARGACRIDVDLCPFDEVRKTKQSSYTVRQSFGKDGKKIYTSIVAAPLLDVDGEVIGIIELTRNITHRILLEEELKATESQLQQFISLAPVATFVKNRQGQYIEANDTMSRMLGHERADVLGKTDFELASHSVAEELRKSDHEVMQHGETVTIDQELQLDSHKIYLHTKKFPIHDVSGHVIAVCGLSNDVSEVKEAELELERTRDYLQNILNNSPVIIITTDLKGNIVSFNRGAEQALGYTFDEVVGKPANFFYSNPEERSVLLRRIASEGAVRDYETSLQCKDGSFLPVSITLSKLRDSSGKMIGTVGMSKDISRRKQLGEQVMQSERLAAVGRLASGVAHEINNPLAVISEIAGYLDEIIDDDPNVSDQETRDELRASLPKISNEVRRCRSITQRLLSFARKSEAREEITDVNHAMEEILPFWEKQAKISQVSLHREYDASAPKVRVEELQLQEIFINIIHNAIQALGQQDGGNIWLKTETENGKVIVTIKDDGPGISQEVRDKIFDPFVSTKPTGQGTGLGLSICYGIIKRHDGEISVLSNPGEGATFRVVLPLYSPSN